MSLTVLLILSKGAQRRKSGEKRKDRKKEATEEEKGCPEKEKLVLCLLEMDRSALYSPWCFVNSLSLLQAGPPGCLPWGEPWWPHGLLYLCAC